MKQIDVKIFDRSYTLAVDDKDQPRLLEAVDMVDKRMREIKGVGKLGSLDRIAVLAALQFANEILGIREEAANARAEAIAAAPESLARIRRMNEALEAEIRRQESLF
ncbi:MAG: cell division protein ZapA [Burkholderiaceae bacterium]|jgi:cell division protein ZapA|nr:cell division protein ZapA [Burkholderiaceae bacterium]MEB2320151.1 cell division protein ZapA [Pseudomonadota bacterium]